MRKDVSMRAREAGAYKMHGAMRLAVCGLFAALIAVGAFLRITIPLQPFPMHFTLQWFFVVLAGLLSDARLAGGSVCAYLAVGLLGVPVFAAGGGPAYLFRPTFGFLLGFAFAACVMGFLGERLRAAGFLRLLLVALAGFFVYYACGMLYFYFISNYVISMPVGWKVVLVNCCLVTAGGDFLLCMLAASAAVHLRPALARMGWRQMSRR